MIITDIGTCTCCGRPNMELVRLPAHQVEEVGHHWLCASCRRIRTDACRLLRRYPLGVPADVAVHAKSPDPRR